MGRACASCCFSKGGPTSDIDGIARKKNMGDSQISNATDIVSH